MDLSILGVVKDFPAIYAFAIGLIAGLGPCPLSTNVTAIAFVSSKFSNARGTMLAGVMYTLGRALTYSVIGVLVYLFGSTVMENAPALQEYDKLILGPVLILAGIIMLELWKPGINTGDALRAKIGLKVAQKGVPGSFALGAIFALAFCPYTAVMFFGLLMPLALESSIAGVGFPMLFGIGTGLPVLIFSVLLGMGASFARNYIDKITRIEPYLRKGLGVIFILYGAFLLISFFI